MLAGPAFASGALLRNVAPLAARDLESIEYVTTATASLAFRREQVAHPLRGFGYVVPRAEGRSVMATTWSSSKFAGRAPEGRVLLRSFLGRAGLEAAAQLDDAEMITLVRRELRDVLGIAAEPEFVEDLPLAARHAPGTGSATRRWSTASRASSPLSTASNSPAAPTTASASATACARAPPPPNAPSSTSAACPGQPPPAPPDVPAADGVED